MGERGEKAKKIPKISLDPDPSTSARQWSTSLPDVDPDVDPLRLPLRPLPDVEKLSVNHPLRQSLRPLQT